MSSRPEFGRMERIFHRVAFQTIFSQEMLADLEDVLFRKEIRTVNPGRPIFVTGLPRSGTTMLLRLVAATGEFATHLYRDVPFVLCPLLWNRISRGLMVTEERRERAHGDGIWVSASSPEAFEEMIWKRFWPDHYLPDRIQPWAPLERDASFEEFFEAHMKKVLLVRGTSRAEGSLHDCAKQPRRYLSKNNVNIARLTSSVGPLADGTFVVSFREPVQHAASMLRQHRRFSRMQAEDGFVGEYMEAIGHHDFGLGLRPIDFGGWLDDAGDADELVFWLLYWTAAYRNVLADAGPSVHLVSYAELISHPGDVLAHLASGLRILPVRLTRQAGRLRPPRTHDVSSEDIPSEILDAAMDIYDRLSALAQSGR